MVAFLTERGRRGVLYPLIDDFPFGHLKWGFPSARLLSFLVKLLKEELTRLLNCKYFSCLPPPPRKSPEVLLSLTSHSSKNILTVPEIMLIKKLASV